jgi:hypothetical protein
LLHCFQHGCYVTHTLSGVGFVQKKSFCFWVLHIAAHT